MTLSKSVLFAFAALVSMAVAETPSGDPVSEIRKNDQQLQALLKRAKSPTPAQRDSLKAQINGIFNFSELAKRSMGKAWTGLKPVQQDTFVNVFRRMVENNSIKRLESYRSDSTVYTPPAGSGDKTQVVATVWLKGKPNKVVYKLMPVDGKWRAWDLVLGDASTMVGYREQFARVMKKDGFDGLIKLLRKNAGA